MTSDNKIALLAASAIQGAGIDNVILAVAIALAESQGNASVTNTNTDGSVDVGLWQINSVHRRTHPEWTPAWLKDEENNAAAMAVVSNGGTNWRPWRAYTNGKYEQYMDRAGSAVLATPFQGQGATGDIVNAITGVTIDPLKAVAETLSGLLSIIQDASKWVGDPSNWIRIVQVVGGVALGIAAVNIVVRPVVEDVGGPAIKAATKGVL